MPPHKFQVGQQVRVLGDSAGWGHGYKLGTITTTTKTIEADAATYSAGRRLGYECAIDGTHWDWVVAEVDLEPTFEPVTDEELEYVSKSLGVDLLGEEEK